MKIFVKAKPGAKEEKIVKKEDAPSLFGPNNKPAENIYQISVKEPPVQGKANRAIAKVLAEHFKVPVSSVSLVSGVTAKNKVFEIPD